MGGDTGPLDRLFCPRSVAVAGASSTRSNLGTSVLRHLSGSGFAGQLFAVHPSASEIAGVPAVRSIGEIPGGADYLFVAVPADAVEPLLRECAGLVRFAQVTTSGFSETGNDDGERRLVAAARAGGMRLLGPNCLGTYCPACRLTFIDRASLQPGRVAIVSQSGGLATDVIRRGKMRGLHFSKVTTIGNAADLGMEELCEYLADDPATGVVGLYLEAVKDGPRFLNAVRHLVPGKPVVVMRGGVTAGGRRAAASHTGSMATEERIWTGICRQLGVAPAETLEAFLDRLLALQFVGSVGRRVLLVGPGGGASVLAADACDRLGFELPAVDDKVRCSLAEVGLGVGTALANPVDLPAGPMARDGGRVAASALDAIVAGGTYDVVLVHLNIQNFVSFTPEGERALSGIVESLIVRRKGTASVLALRSSGEPDIDAIKRRLTEMASGAGIPTYDSIEHALSALAVVRDLQELWSRRNVPVSARSRSAVGDSSCSLRGEKP